jgi:membrane fusion protein, copper/silver efflux system
MKRAWVAGLLMTLVAGAFLAGAWVSWQASGRDRSPDARKILYWVDPMHPSYKSDKPGIAPDCGMQLEPVYADEVPLASGAAVPANALKVTADKQQTIGVTTGIVARAPMQRTLRTVGRVAPDENRVYRLVTAIDGWTKDVFAGQTGAIVRENQLLLTFYSREFLAAQAAYFYALDSRDRFHAEGGESPNQRSTLENQVRTAAETLQALGMDQIQLAEVAKTRQAATDIALRSPTTGYIVARNVYPRQRFDRGTELYRIVDISRVWVVADVFERDAQHIPAGAIARVSLPDQERGPIQARVGSTLPQFDPATRTLKLRLEVDNPAYLLRPDMLVDVSIDISLPQAVTVPRDAVVDSGGRKTVFVARGNGYFEPRQVKTGWRDDDRIEIVKGLMPGERIVISGNFLLDSESRMRRAAMGISTPDTDPVCGMEVDQGKAEAAGRLAVYRGQTYYFCSDDCKKRFETTPSQYAPDPNRPVVPGLAAPAAAAPASDAIRPSRLPSASSAGSGDEARGMAFPQLPRQRSMGPGTRPRTNTLAAAEEGVSAPPKPVEAVEPTAQTPSKLPLADVKKASMDPVSRIMVDEESAAAAGLKVEHKGKIYFFVSKECKDQFTNQPDLYVGEAEAVAVAPAAAPPTTATAPVMAPATVIDPVCGKGVAVKAAVAAGFVSDYKGTHYYFCSDDCKKKFDKEPGKYAVK